MGGSKKQAEMLAKFPKPLSENIFAILQIWVEIELGKLLSALLRDPSPPPSMQAIDCWVDGLID